MAAVGEIRQNPGGRRVLLLGQQRTGGQLWATLQLNGRFYGQRFGVIERELEEWPVIATLPPDDYGARP